MALWRRSRGSAPEQGGERPGAAWTGRAGWGRVAPQGGPGTKASGRVIVEGGGEGCQTRCQTLTWVTHPSTARTALMRPRATSWASSTQAHISWRQRAGARRGGTEASLQCRAGEARKGRARSPGPCREAVSGPSIDAAVARAVVRVFARSAGRIAAHWPPVVVLPQS